jgi:hypothetical protein
MNLICFPNYTCGAILCDILNKESSQVGKNNNFYSAKHNYGKIPANTYNGKEYDPKLLYDKTLRLDNVQQLKGAWIGTHCWPGLIDNTLYENIICISTENRNSKIYRFARVFYTMVAGRWPDQPKPQKPKDIMYYNAPFEKVHKSNIINIEFEHWVNLTPQVEDVLLRLAGHEYKNHFIARRKKWIEINDFLYDQRFDFVKKEWEKHNG